MIAWHLMFVLAFALFGTAKCFTWWQHRIRGRQLLQVGYLLAWPGMDAEEFLTTTHRPPEGKAWLAPTGKVVTGAIITWTVPGLLFPVHPIAAAWAGMAGLVLLLHFGCFELAALLWQSAGIAAHPIMQRPALATSLSDFWSHRWNVAFHRLAHDYVFCWVSRRCGVITGLMGTFLASGLVHDLVISVPARGGYGLPTAYFLLQGLGVCLERSPLGRHWGLRRGLRGRLFALSTVLLPAYWLFHPAFVQRVMLPLLGAIGSVGVQS